MRNLSPQRRRATILAASCAAIIPSVLLLSRDNARMADHTATFAGMAVGIVVGVSILLVRRRRHVC